MTNETIYTFEFTTKEQYLAWRAEWKARYKKVSAEIRGLRMTRKMNRYEYRAKGDTNSKRRIVIGPNNLYDLFYTSRCYPKSKLAANLMEELRQAKERSWLLKQANLKEMVRA